MGIPKLRDNCYTYNDYKYWEDSEDWEIIGGKAYQMAPSPNTFHQDIAGEIHSEFRIFLKGKPCKVFSELDVVLSEEDIVKPDVFIVCDKEKIKENNIQGVPDIIVEILSPSTSKRDKGVKFDLYKKHKVKEYWIIDQYNLIIEIYYFETGEVKRYFFDEETEENNLEVALFNNELKIDVNELFRKDW